MTPSFDMERLSESPLLVALTESQIEKFLEAGSIVEYEEGATILQAGGVGDALFLILKGEVLISLDENTPVTVLSGEDTLAAQYEGDFFGEMSVLDHEPRAASVIAAGQTRLLKIGKEALYRLFKNDVDLQVVLLTNMGRILSRRLRSTNLKMIKHKVPSTRS